MPWCSNLFWDGYAVFGAEFWIKKGGAAALTTVKQTLKTPHEWGGYERRWSFVSSQKSRNRSKRAQIEKGQCRNDDKIGRCNAIGIKTEAVIRTATTKRWSIVSKTTVWSLTVIHVAAECMLRRYARQSDCPFRICISSCWNHNKSSIEVLFLQPSVYFRLQANSFFNFLRPPPFFQYCSRFLASCSVLNSSENSNFNGRLCLVAVTCPELCRLKRSSKLLV